MPLDWVLLTKGSFRIIISMLIASLHIKGMKHKRMVRENSPLGIGRLTTCLCHNSKGFLVFNFFVCIETACL